jgi:hypothetical protein
MLEGSSRGATFLPMATARSSICLCPLEEPWRLGSDESAAAIIVVGAKLRRTMMWAILSVKKFHLL